MNLKDWTITEKEFKKENTELNGSRYIIGNGYMGYRGTYEEFGKQELVALNMAGLFDKNGDSWRESVNAPNPLYTKVFAGDSEVSFLECAPSEHERSLDIRHGLHSRKTVFEIDGTSITITAKRFLSIENEHIIGLNYTVSADKPVNITVKTGIDGDVWDINGPHFVIKDRKSEGRINSFSCQTVENGIKLTVYEFIDANNAQYDNSENAKLLNVFNTVVTPENPFNFKKLAGVYWGDEVQNSEEMFKESIKCGYDEILRKHNAAWENIWDRSDVVIDGDEEAQRALRYSLYQLISVAPRGNGKCGIPARGLSGQVYKGASFWDTEMFMQPFFSFTDPQVSRKLADYRINTIAGAKRKAKEYGFDGAFYAWESQETGDDACTLFNITDVFTKRPIRTYFRDKQIHVSADMVYGLWEYCNIFDEYRILADGGLDLIYQCVRFFYSYAYTKLNKRSYEFLDVVGPDEYHERVNNNAYTNKMIERSAEILLSALTKVKLNYPEYYKEFTKKNDIEWIEDFKNNLYVPSPDENGIIEQFDGYKGLEDITLENIKKRVIDPNEYWGCGQGIATTTRILKQADVIMMLNVFRKEYSKEILEANWNFYEPYTEHGSSLSACAYAIVAANIGNTEWAYKYFMKTATVDLTGNSRQYLGTLYIGGTHPAANGGSWNTAIFGFAGVSYDDDVIDISPHLPEKWESMSFKLAWKGTELSVNIKGTDVKIKAISVKKNINITVYGKKYHLE